MRILRKIFLYFLPICLVLFLPIAPVLVITDRDTMVKFIMSVNSDQVIVEYTHSLTNDQVKDIFSVEEGKLLLTSVKTRDYAYGFPTDSRAVLEDDWYVFDINPPQVFNPLIIQVGYKMKPFVYSGGKGFSLVQHFGEGSVVVITHQRMSYLFKWAGSCI